MPLVESSAIHRIEYDGDRRVLQIWFRGRRGPYSYFDVPEAEYDRFLEASSKGAFFNREIRNRYDYSR